MVTLILILFAIPVISVVMCSILGGLIRIADKAIGPVEPVNLDELRKVAKERGFL
jgi:hypothetical protein